MPGDVVDLDFSRAVPDGVIVVAAVAVISFLTEDGDRLAVSTRGDQSYSGTLGMLELGKAHLIKDMIDEDDE